MTERSTTDGQSAVAWLPRRERVGKYELCVRGPSGGMATVYLGVQRGASGFRKPVAVKRIHPHLVEDESLRTMFAAEARVVSLVEHPFVCRVEDFGEDQGCPYLVMEYLVGESLHAVFRAIRARGRENGPSLPVIARIIANLAEALHAVHEATDESGTPLGVVHRDVSPSNLFVLYDGSVRLTDFGIARTRTAIQHTATGVLKGKLSYMAPEQASAGPIDRRTDVFALGIVMWEFITNRRLYRAPTDIDALKLAAEAKVPKPSEKGVEIPASLEAVLMRCLARDPDDRYPTAHALAEALDEVMRSDVGYPRAAQVAACMAYLFPGELEKKRAIIRRAVSDLSDDGMVTKVEGVYARRTPLPSPRPMPDPMPANDISGPDAPPTPSGSVPLGPQGSSPEVPVLSIEVDSPTVFASRNPRYAGTEATTKREVKLRVPSLAPRAPVEDRGPSIAPVVIGTLVLFLGWGLFATTMSGSNPPPQQQQASAPSAQPSARVPPPANDVRRPVTTASGASLTAVGPAAPAVAPTPSSADRAPRASAPMASRMHAAAPPAPRATPAPAPTMDEAAAGARGQAFVTTRGFTAEVSSGGRTLGRTPLRIDLPVGSHTLSLRHAETGTTQAVRVDIERGRVVFVALGGD